MEFYALVDQAHAAGLKVMTRSIGRHHGRYLHKHQLIMLSPRLTGPQTISALAHELGHAHYGDDGPQTPEIEARAWRWASRALIDPRAYAEAEARVGHHRGAIARELGVRRIVVDTWAELQDSCENVRYINFGAIEQGA